MSLYWTPWLLKCFVLCWFFIAYVPLTAVASDFSTWHLNDVGSRSVRWCYGSIGLLPVVTHTPVSYGIGGKSRVR